MRSCFSSSSRFSTSVLAAVLMSILSVLVFGPAPTTAVSRMWPIGIGGIGTIDWATQFVWDPNNETMIFVSDCVSPGCLLFSWNPLTYETVHLAFTGTANAGTRPAAFGTSATYNGAYGITLAIKPEDGTILGYLIGLFYGHRIDMVGASWPHPVTTVAGTGTTGFADGTGTGCTVNAPSMMNYHRRWRKMFLAGNLDHKVRLLEWQSGTNNIKCTALAGDGAAGYDDPTRKCNRPNGVAPAPHSGAQPIALFFTERPLVQVRRIHPVSATGALTTVFQYAGTTNAGRNCDIIEMPGGNFRMLVTGIFNTGELYEFKFTTDTIITGGGENTAGNKWVRETNIAVIDGNTLWTGALPNGTLVALQGTNPSVRVWQRADFFAGSLTKSRSITRCNTNPAEIDTTTTFPAGTIAPITDSIFDFSSFTPLCCASITPESFITSCKGTLNTCTGSVTGLATYTSTKYLLDGSFSTTDNAKAWGRSCIKNYIKCMRDGAKAATLKEHPLCTWASDALNKLNDPSECEVFVSATFVGMQSPTVATAIAAELCATTSAPVASPASPFGSTDSDIVASIPGCTAESGYRCQRTYHSSPSCTCPDTTTAQNLQVITGIASLSTNNAAVLQLHSSAQTCIYTEAIISICTSRQNTKPFPNAFIRDALTANANGIKYDIGGSCVQVNPKTGYCSCPYNHSAFEYVIPVYSVDAKTTKRILTFCMPRGTATFFQAATYWEPVALDPYSCVHPFGTNYTCGCTKYAVTRRVPISIYPTRTSSTPVAGDITFCDSDVIFPDEVDPKVVAGVVGVTVIGGITGGSIQGLQAAALSMTMCGANKSDGARKMLVFTTIDQAGEAAGLAFVTILGIVVVVAHWFAAVLVFIVLVLCNVPHEEFETGQTVADPSMADRWVAACLKVRYPHWCGMFLRVVFPGFVMEAAAVLRTREMPYTAIGGIALVVAVVYCIVVFYISFFSLREHASEEMVLSDHAPDEVGEDDEEEEGAGGAGGNNKYKEADTEMAGIANEAEGGGSTPAAASRQVYVKSAAADEDGDAETPGGPSHVETAQSSSTAVVETPSKEEDSSKNKDKQGNGNRKGLKDPMDGDFVTVNGEDYRLPPYFLWYTQYGSKHQFGSCLNWCYIPSGWWCSRRFYTRRYASFYNMFVPRASRWMPTFLQLFMLVLSALTASEGCEVPMSIVGVLNFGAAAVYGLLRPGRRPLENLLMTGQFGVTGIMSIVRGQEKPEAVQLFYVVAMLAVIQMVHIGTIQLIEVGCIYDEELERFHDANKVSEENAKRAVAKKYEVLDE